MELLNIVALTVLNTRRKNSKMCISTTVCSEAESSTNLLECTRRIVCDIGRLIDDLHGAQSNSSAIFPGNIDL